jgi:hypothetical protein
MSPVWGARLWRIDPDEGNLPALRLTKVGGESVALRLLLRADRLIQ